MIYSGTPASCMFDIALQGLLASPHAALLAALE